MPMQHMKAPESAQCYASTLYENPQSVPCQCNTWRFPNELGAQRNTWRFPNELSAMPAQYMKAPEQARCHVSAIHEGSRTSSETQKLLVQAIEETVRNVKFFLKANSVIEEQKSTVRFAGTCSWSDCISSPNISSFVGHGLMNGAVAPCSAFTSRVKVRMYMSLCLHVIAGFTHTHATFHTQLCHPPSLTPHLSHHFVTHTPPFTHNFVTHHLSPHHLSHHFVTHHLSPHHLSHTTLSHTIFPTQLCHTHNFVLLLESSTTSFVFPFFPLPATTFGAHYWKKLPCGVIWSFNFPFLPLSFNGFLYFLLSFGHWRFSKCNSMTAPAHVNANWSDFTCSPKIIATFIQSRSDFNRRKYQNIC